MVWIWFITKKRFPVFFEPICLNSFLYSNLRSGAAGAKSLCRSFCRKFSESLSNKASRAKIITIWLKLLNFGKKVVDFEEIDIMSIYYFKMRGDISKRGGRLCQR